MNINLTNKNTKEILDYFRGNIKDLEKRFIITVDKQTTKKVNYKQYIDLAQLFYCKVIDIEKNERQIYITFEKIDTNNSFHKTKQNDEKYGVDGDFFDINKNEYFNFIYYYENALNFININKRKSILNLGINSGNEFLAIKDILTKEEFEAKQFVGIDYCKSAIDYAKQNITNENISFICEDINNLENSNIGKFDLIISIGTLQSSNLNFNLTFQNIIQNHLNKDGSIILGFPNCRWYENEMIYGANVPHYNFAEMSMVIKDIYFCKKYLQQKKFKVIITGKEYLFLSARKIST
jgi:SAM-dependent methyltransferase